VTSLFLFLAPAFGLSLAIVWRQGWRWAALYAFLMTASLAGAVEMMGGPKPIWLEWRDTSEMQVLGAHYEPEVAIYVWVLTDKPRAYVLPWSDENARKMQEAANGGIPYMLDYDHEDLEVHPMPVLPSPPKQ